ncbi:hypothetical protein OSB04_000467 [Centaurea solstitialis]|uniref:Uncharacterized protein n=1 Tax=Centaurea solstitialis TaxID=347529 RepID=A0AA38WUK0_9ASTR|nr:hypothetical protein OSB04_000467 [Centaurea solstitialis]
MAVGKSRGPKRPTGGSCSSTATVVVFIFVCVFGVWMLTSNSIVSPQKKSIIMDTVFDNVQRKRNLPRKIPTNPTVFEDNPGDLPADAIKSDDDFMAHDAEMDRNFSKNQHDESKELTHQHDDHEITSNVSETLNDTDIVNRQEKKRKKKPDDTQSFEEDTKPFKQHTENMITDKKRTENAADLQESNRINQDKQTTDVDDQENRTKNEEHEKGLDEDSEIQSHSIANETKTQFENQEAKKETTPTSKKDETRSFGIPNESNDAKNEWSTQADQSTDHNSRSQNDGGDTAKNDDEGYKWELCNVTAGNDYIPCLDNVKAISALRGRRNHYEHRQRLCPDEPPTCLVPLPEGYKTPLSWPQSRDKIWFSNVPHKGLAAKKGHQNWMKLTGEFLSFPGGGTQFIHGALHYIDFVQQIVPEIEWGKHTRVVLDVGCGVASFGGFLFDRNVITMSFAPKDEHEAQVQFALERGIPAISAVMGTQRLPFSSGVFDLVHCARCRVPWHREGGTLLLELNRVLRPGGYFVWSATPVYQKNKEDVEIWEAMSALTTAMCWELITIKTDKVNGIGVAVYQKPTTNECYDERKTQEPPVCHDNPDAAWYVALQTCMHKVATMEAQRGSQWPEDWPARVQAPPYWLNKSQIGIYGKPAPNDFEQDYENWKSVVTETYMNGLKISWSNVRNVMDMRAVYGGFAAALKDLKLWVMNVVNIDSPDTLPVIYERGLLGIYHDWCESFSTYPRTYDLLHADHLFSKLKNRCKITPVIVEVDRIARPGGKLIVRDDSSMLEEIKNLLESLHWEVYLTSFKNHERILSAQKSTWRPKTYATQN